ncbi:MAG: effector-associated constant component EACC1 [Acidimicrobiia bacterium]
MTDDTPPAGTFELVLEPQSGRYDPDDERWREQVGQFVDALRREVGGVRRERTAVEGTKGSVETLIVALGSAGAFTAAVEFFRSWIGRDKSRSLDICWTAEEGQCRVSIRGDAVDQTTLQVVAEAAARQLRTVQEPWAATEPC